MKSLPGILVQAVLVGSLLGCAARPTNTTGPTVAPAPCRGPSITLGEISDDPDEVIRDTQPFADYLAAQLTPYGIRCGKVKVANNVGEMIEMINTGEVDIYFDSMFPSTLVSDATGAKPILRRWRNCDPEYYSVIATTEDSGIKSLEDLPGHVVAMDRPDSTSGTVLPAAYLLDHGLKLVVKETYDAAVGKDEVGIHFTFDDQNTLALIQTGKVSAVATDDYNYGQWQKASSSKLVLLGETEPILRQAVLLRPNLDNRLQAGIKQVLLQAHLNPEGLAILEQVVSTCKFDEVPEEMEAAFGKMRLMYTRMQTVPGWTEALSRIE